MDGSYSCESGDTVEVDDIQNLLARKFIESEGYIITLNSLAQIMHGTKPLAKIAVQCCNDFKTSEALSTYSDLVSTFFKLQKESEYISNILHKKIYESLEDITKFYGDKGTTIIYRYSKLLNYALNRIKPSTINTLERFIENLDFDLTTKEGAKELNSAFKDYDLILDLVYDK